MEIELNKQILLIDDKLANVKDQIKILRKEERDLCSERLELLNVLKDSQESGKSAMKQDWSGEDFPWSSKVREILTQFNISDFRTLQLESINTVLSGFDLLLVMPTGGGKSLCYQIPALIKTGFCLVVSPLISLMEDQTLSLLSLGINAKLLSSDISRVETNSIYKLLSNPSSTLKFLFVTPERICKSKKFVSCLEKAHENSLLSLIVIDEVHCTSQWGHDFRPDYKKLCIFKLQFSSVPILGLTATATAQVLHDVQDILRLSSPLVYRSGFNRPNLFFEVRIKAELFRDQVAALVNLINREFSGTSGIIYCISKKDCEYLTTQLAENRLSVACYHAGVPMARRNEVHHSWLRGDVLIVVSTVAFGLGIDKKDVRFVIHHSFPKSIANYYQECGRAGRDGKPARCVLFFRPQDYFPHSSMVMTEKIGIRNLNAITRYCLDGSTCRRVLIAKHFNESFSTEECNTMCDNCLILQDILPDCPGHNTDTIVEHIYNSLFTLLESASVRKERLTAAKLLTLWKKEYKLQSREVSNFACMCIILQGLIDNIIREDYHFTPYNTISYIVAGPCASRLLKNPSTIPELRINNMEVRNMHHYKITQLIDFKFAKFNSSPLLNSKLNETKDDLVLTVDSDSTSDEDCKFLSKRFCPKETIIQQSNTRLAWTEST
ncbi:hypothetical protein LOD99_4838 [Oopsacas minuta]|uniref:ATP-dependent DNA helicase n=1 Tax=Oopsacas minuta TaxID=111878 RepID=A0AAV7JRG2_9METZ|nr:hypothetical protein LOD99_4838 [Oopsacas minuta]